MIEETVFFALKDVVDVRPFLSDGFGCGEAASGRVLGCLNRAELTGCLPDLELCSNLGGGHVAHSPAECIPQNDSLVGNGLALKGVGFRVCDGLPRLVGLVRGDGILIWCGSGPR